MTGFTPCTELAFHCDDPLLPLRYSPRFDEYFIERRAGASSQMLVYCPFCGAKLPESRRNSFFDVLEASGIDYRLGEDDQLPDEFKTDAWWKRRKP